MKSLGYAYPICVAVSDHMQEEITAEVKEKTAQLYKRAEHEGRTIKEIRSTGSVVQPGLLEDGPNEPTYLGHVRSFYE